MVLPCRIVTRCLGREEFRHRDRGRVDADALEGIQRDSTEVGHHRLEGVGVTEQCDHLTGVPGDDLLHRPGHPLLHLGEALPTGETEGGGLLLHRLPFRQFVQVGEFLPRPFTELALDEVIHDLWFQSELPGGRCGGLPGAFHRGGVDGGQG